jgi:ELWxxDGT repeat protein
VTAVGTKVFFAASDSTANGNELCVSDGTTVGTTLVKDINGTASGSGVSNLKAVGNNVMFYADDGTNGSELWISDGTSAGTVRVTNQQSPVGSNPGNFTSVPLTVVVSETRFDYNGDGKSDILWRNGISGTFTKWLMNGSAVSSSPDIATLAPSLGWVIAGTGDFNGDGKSDILWRNTVSGTVTEWLMNGSTIMSSPDILTVAPASGWSIIAVAGS